MAMRSSGGTGVLIALIIFIFLTVGSGTTAIILYGKKNAAEDLAKTREQDLAALLDVADREHDSIKTLKQEATTNSVSLVRHMLNKARDYRTFVTGDPNADEATTRSNFGIADSMTLKEAWTGLSSKNTTLNGRISSLETKVDDVQSLLDERDKDYAQLESDRDHEVAEVQATLKTDRDASAEYQQKLGDAKNNYQVAIDRKEQDHRNQVDGLQAEIDDLNSDHTVVTSRLNELRKVVDAIRIRPKNPAELVDGRVVDVLGASGQVFINLGRNDRVKPGMTFEVYDTAGQIRVNENTGDYSRGKASLQIIKVADHTATARITRTAGSRPVVRDDVIANAVFNPEYRFKFLVYGLFDVDNSGSASEAEADYIRSKIIDWGGEVVEGARLTGDLDFLVLGEVPDYIPAELIRTNATEAEINAIMQKREAYDRYDELFKQAINAQIPVLNWNRFRILTGETG